MMCSLKILVAILLLVIPYPQLQSATFPIPVDLELALLVDASSSMDKEEQALQRLGYIRAIRHPEIVKVIREGPIGRIALTYVEFYGAKDQRIIVPWTIVEDDESAGEVAGYLSEAGLEKGPFTSISAGMEMVGGQMLTNEFEGTKLVVDVSGDGPNNAGKPVAAVRDALVALGIGINGLPIMLRPEAVPYEEFARLDEYYKDCIIGGPGAFIMPITATDQFIPAIRNKLALEIGSAPTRSRYAESGARVVLVGTLQHTKQVSRSDCLVGETLHKEFLDRFWAEDE
ncbi:DUF1194 domain-containing protein [Candidatus Parcubacteria bacterium]|nr:MAG: DUF1194 domain-containing protein [Candidatus Parcubacteria bacterium]